MKKLLIAAALLSLAACSSLQTTVLPKENSVYQLVATAGDAATAQKGAAKKARKVCEKQEKTLIVISNNSSYQGASKKLEGITKVLSSATMLTGNGYMASSGNSTDYQTIIEFKCQ